MTENNWERRWQPLFQEWVIIAAKTGDRPWSGREFKDTKKQIPEHDKTCYLCPGNVRASKNKNPDYKKPWSFENDFASLSFQAPSPEPGGNELHLLAPAHGICRVLCWHPRHDLTLAAMSEEQLLDVVKLWQEEFNAIRAHEGIEHVLIFENKGTEIGVSNPHPHGQVYASNFVPAKIQMMRTAQHQYFQSKNRKLVIDLVSIPEHADLVIEENSSFIAATPFAARFPYEAWIVAKRSIASVSELTSEEVKDLTVIYSSMLKRYNNLFQREAPNITLLQNAPVDQSKENEAWQFLIIFQPPLRDLTKLKYLAGYESGTNCIINPVQPEIAASRLRQSATERRSES